MGNCLAKQKKYQYQDARQGVALTDRLEIQQPNYIQTSQTPRQDVLDPSIQFKSLEIKPATSTQTEHKLQNNEQIIPKKPIVRVFMKYNLEKSAAPRKGIRVYHTCSLSHICSPLESVEDLWFSHNQIGFSSAQLSKEQRFETLKRIKRALKIHNWKSIKSLNFSTHRFGSENITGKEVKTFIIDIGKQLNLKKVKFDFTYSQKIKDKGLEAFGTSINRYLTNLESLTVTLRSCQNISRRGFHMFGVEVCKHLYRLKHLSLDFSGCEGVVGRAIKTLGSNISRNLVELKQLQLQFLNCHRLSDVGLDLLGSEISRDRFNLEQLTLNFSGCIQKRDQSLEAFQHNVHRNLFSLQQFTLILERSSITDKGLKALGMVVSKHLKNLKRFSLNLSGSTEITDQGLEYLTSAISTNLSSLKYLALDLSSCRKISDNGLEAFAIQLSNCATTLEGLSLDFQWCNLSNSGIEKLCFQASQRLPNLKQIHLNLQYCSDITQDILTKFMYIFVHIPNSDRIINLRELK